jgi:hypothetical protein
MNRLHLAAAAALATLVLLPAALVLPSHDQPSQPSHEWRSPPPPPPQTFCLYPDQQQCLWPKVQPPSPSKVLPHPDVKRARPTYVNFKRPAVTRVKRLAPRALPANESVTSGQIVEVPIQFLSAVGVS